MVTVPQKMEDIVRFALQLESDGLRMYRDLAEKSDDPLCKKTFEGLAEDEEEHLEMLQKIYGASHIDEVEEIVARSKHEPVRQRFRTIFQLAGEEARKRAEADPSDSEAMRIAMDFEKRGYDFYRKAQEEATGPMEKSILKHLTLMEKGHYELLKETYDYLTDTENWFMKNEGWMFDGG